MNIVILANGNYPSHEVPLGCLGKADLIVCCDGAVEKLVANGLEPGIIIGDLDSVTPALKIKYAGIIVQDLDQDTNDLTKAVNWCVDRNYENLVILGATGNREDHTIGNISLLAEYVKKTTVKMITDTGIITPHLTSSRLSSFRGQQISVFSVDPETGITSVGLKYKLENMKLRNWWQATLNEAEGNTFDLIFEGGPLIVFQKFRK